MSPRPPRISSKPVKTLGSNPPPDALATPDRKSTRLNSSHGYISYAVFCLKKKKHTTETAGGYAREMGEDYQRRQRERITEALKRTDIVICTALIPGRKARVLMTRGIVAAV